MQLRRNKLALLISLIGAGVAPYAYARSDSRVVGPIQSPLSVALAESASWTADPIWRAEDGALEIVRLPDDLHASIWARPSDAAVIEELRDEASGQALEETRESPTEFSEFSDAAPGEMSREAQASMAARDPPARAKGNAGATSRQAARSAAAGTPQAQPAEDTASRYTERLMESLAAVVLDDADALAGDAASPALALAGVAQAVAQAVTPAAAPTDSPPAAVLETAQESIGAQLRATESVALPVEQREIVVAPPAEKVLRDLETLLWGDADRTGVAAAPPPAETFVATQTDKVLETLFDVSSAYRVDEEEPAQRRARKLAAAQARDAAAAGEAPAVTSHAPPTPPTPVTLAVRQAMLVDVDLTQLMPVEPQPAMLPEPGDDAVVALAMEPGPMMLWIAARDATSGIDIDADESAPRLSPFGSEKVAINNKTLDRVRGGFFGDGLNISFGIERAVYVNGTLVTTTSLNISDLGRITAGRGTASFDNATLALIQSGAGNTMVPGASVSPTSIGTVIQNTLNGQKIQSVTVINATVNSLGVLRGLNLGSSMRSAVIDSLRR